MEPGYPFGHQAIYQGRKLLHQDPTRSQACHRKFTSPLSLEDRGSRTYYTPLR